MLSARIEVDATSLQGVISEWFFRRGMKISSVDIRLVGDHGDWEIAAAYSRGSTDHDTLARQAEAQLRPIHRLVRINVHRVDTPASQE